ncbi:uncharacterized protein LOC133290261 [Gastrolobium bilobum]|uniref:uncharacterized protein LOC133290261 n=1 Tax=Gastrolobium bilobum TaxID=150636 RepID=UPI002AB19B16|nr:uncharacterized protein LOC133290261 [Gastrolobium bilobum]
MNYNNCWENYKVLGIDLMDCEPVIISREEYFLFHNIDRELYKILVIDLSREPDESLRIVALLLWLERIRYGNVVKSILSLPKILITAVADEALLCYNCVMDSNPTAPWFIDNVDLRVLRTIVNKPISLPILIGNRDLAIHGIAKTYDVCLRALSDIMKQAQIRNLAACIIRGMP